MIVIEGIEARRWLAEMTVKRIDESKINDEAEKIIKKNREMRQERKTF